VSPSAARDRLADLRRLGRGILEIALPAECAGCGERLRTTERAVCGGCLDRLQPPQMPICPACGMGDLNPKRRCPGCLPGESAWEIARQAAIWSEPMPTLIHALKFHGLTEVRWPFADLLARLVEREMGPAPWDLIAPVPLHRTRERERGFNQSALIARALGQRLGWPVDLRAVRRHRATRTQTNLGRGQRLANVEGAFSCPRPESIADKRILLVDDVHTTGATMRAAAQALREAGAREVGACAVARAVL
jgi:ComF family protein